jgi:TetR/AcrR family transcriptional regulator
MTGKTQRGRSAAPGARRIESAAQRLFAKRGFAGTSMADIAAAAGVSKATVFHHYRSKDQLYGALINDAVAGFREQLVPLLDAEGEMQRSLQKFVAAHVERLARMGGTLQLVMRGILDGSPGSLKALSGGAMAENFSLIVAALRRAQQRGAISADADAGLAAVVLLCTTWFVIQNAAAVRRNPDLAVTATADSYAAELARLLYLGLAPRHAPRIQDQS